MKKFIAIVLIVCLYPGDGYPYAAHGHQLVGAIADRRLAKNKVVANKVKLLLDGLTLEQVSTFPDEIKDWDSCSHAPKNTLVTNKKRIHDELRALVNANRCNGNPSHHEFHFSDIPVFGNEKYADGQVGRSKFDIVQMIPFCIRVLKSEEPGINDRAITSSH